MLVRFSCLAQLPLGQFLRVTSTSHAHLDGLQLRWGPDNRWEGDCEIPPGDTVLYAYSHERHAPERSFYADPVLASSPSALVLLFDELHSRPDLFSQTSAFKRVFFPSMNHGTALPPALSENAGATATSASGASGTVPSAGAASTLVIFHLNCWRVHSSQELRITGSLPALGAWSAPAASNVLAVRIYPSDAPFEYKFLITPKNKTLSQSDRNDPNANVVWESGPNRRFTLDTLQRQSVSVVHVDCGSFRWPTHVSSWKVAGTAVPLFSLRSSSSCGVGEYTDIAAMAAFCKRTGLRVLQLLPVNDTRNSYPYGCLSVFALHPVYINLDAVFQTTTESSRYKELIEEYPSKRREYEELEDFDFDAVFSYKMHVLKGLWAGLGQKGQAAVIDSAEVRAFRADNEDWLPFYAKFKGEDERFIVWIQYHAHVQLLKASKQSEELGVALKGDLPIGVALDSCDVQQHPHLFLLNTCAGAPPDYFSRIGQNWGFPTYNWPAHVAEDYRWWRRRFTVLSKYFHAIRIDHVLGLFRIWTIPRGDVTGMRGRFVPSIPVTRAQLEAAGIWDIERLTTPEFELNEVPSQYVSLYFDVTKENRLRFKPQYSRESQLPPELYEYLSDVCLLPAIPLLTKRDASTLRTGNSGGSSDSSIEQMVESLSDMDLFEKNGEIFYPRFDLHTTRSFSKLPHEWQRALDGMRREHFYGHAQNELWRENGTQRLAMLIRASDMLLCAEDLGLIPDCVPEVLDSLQIACLKVQRMPRETWAEFDHPHTYPYLSVCCPSTHDMSTLRGWWEEDRGRTQRFYENVMGCSGASPQFAEPWVCRRVLSGMLHSNAMLAIFAIQDWMAVDGNLRRENPFVEQINVPANPKHVWKYRMHLRVDDLVGNEDFVNEVHSMVQESGRLQ